ncbi:MAG: hypothetical protein DRI61_10375 [Chloroflexi bacterium]|nr:MAG: hypothetical protein DRI61_10375 [Chloroflexota bacterium]
MSGLHPFRPSDEFDIACAWFERLGRPELDAGVPLPEQLMLGELKIKLCKPLVKKDFFSLPFASIVPAFGYSPEALDLLLAMFAYAPTRRITAPFVAAHSYFVPES